MERAKEDTIKTGIPRVGYRISSAFRLSFLLLIFACEIEDDFGKPDNSEDYGTELYTSPDYLMKIVWSEGTNEVIALNSSAIAAIDVTTHTIRQISSTPISPNGSDMIWIDKDVLYFINTDSQLTSINIQTSDINKTLVDSVLYVSNANPFYGNILAFNKYNNYDPYYEPYLFLYDADAKKEILITSGVPITFSPDGETLLFTREYSNYFFYELKTKTIRQAQFQNYYGNGVIRWTSDGILLFIQQGPESVLLFNASTNESIGEWESIAYPSLGSISPSGQQIVIHKLKCSIPFVTGYCTYMKQHYSIIDIPRNIETEVAYGNYYIPQMIISPSGNSLAIVLHDNKIFLAEAKD